MNDVTELIFKVGSVEHEVKSHRKRRPFSILEGAALVGVGTIALCCACGGFLLKVLVW